MATVAPLKGIRYTSHLAQDLPRLITPPYDVISEEDQERYYAAHPRNIIRLELGKTLPGDNAEQNRYTRAAADLHRWLEERVLVEEEKPALYLYRQEFSIRGAVKARTGVICRVKAEPYQKGVIVPHEETLPGHKKDRLELMRACAANFSPIFGLYMDKENLADTIFKDIAGQEPALDFADAFGQRHRLWVVTGESTIAAFAGLLQDKRVYIADGHHRYETALAYASERKENGAYVMMTLVNLYDPGLVVLPTHRLVKNVEIDLNELIKQLGQNFIAAGYNLGGETGLKGFMTILDGLFREGRHVFGLYAGEDRMHLLVLKKDICLEHLMPADRSKAWQELDVAILQELVTDKILGIDTQKQISAGYLDYTRDEGEAISSVLSGRHRLAFLLNPTPVRSIIEVAQNREKMPQKSTYFYPKLVTGLVINKLD